MRAVEQWSALERGLEDGWSEVELSFTAEDTHGLSQAASVLAPLQPGRVGPELRLAVRRGGGELDRLRNVLGRLDRKRVWGTLRIVTARVEAQPEAPASPSRRRSLVDGWENELAKLPAGWRDAYLELELDSTDYLPRAALLGAPLNPSRNPKAIALRFRVSTGDGYGAARGMARRAFERMDAEGITGRVTVLHALSDTDNVATQGPVWRVDGRAV